MRASPHSSSPQAGAASGAPSGERILWRLAPLALLPAWLAVFAAVRPLAEPDEGRYTHVARWMTQSGDWLVPRVNGLPFLHKPPLYYWLEAAAIEVFGPGLLTARLVSILAGLLMAACVYAVVASRKGEHSAVWSVAVLATSPLFFAGAQFANLDMLVASFITLTLTLAIKATEAPAGKDRRLWVGAYAAAALGVLTKGAIGAVLPGAIFLIWAHFEGRPDFIRRAISLLGAAIFLAISAPWFVLMEMRFPGFNRSFFLYHHVARFLTGEFNGHMGPWFYPVLVFAGVLPWSASLIAIWRVRPVGYAQLLDGIILAPLRRLAAIWLLFVLIFFSIPSSKMIGYILPVLPAFAMLAGPVVARWQHRRLALFGAVILCVAFGVVGPHWQKRTPIALARTISHLIEPGDSVFLADGISYDAVVELDRSRSPYIVGSWSHRSIDMPDSLPRQLVEGREWDPAAGHVLIGDAEFETLTSRPERTAWIIAHKGYASKFPWLAQVPVLEESGYRVLLKVPAK